MTVNAYRKTIAAVLGAAGTWCVAALPDGRVSTMEWVALGIALATALGVYAVPNTPTTNAPDSATVEAGHKRALDRVGVIKRQARQAKRPAKRGDAGLTGLGVVLAVVILLIALSLGAAVHPLFFLLIILCLVVLL